MFDEKKCSIQKGDLVTWHKDFSPDVERLDACKIGVVLEKPSTFAAHERGWWVYFHPHRMLLYEEDLVKLNVSKR